MVPFERALVSSYKCSIVTFLFLHLYAFQRYCRFCSPERHFSYHNIVSPKFPHAPLGLGGSPFGCKERRCWANSLYNSFPRFPTYVITIHQRHGQTDRRTDGRHAIARSRAAVHCAVKRKNKKAQLTHAT